MVAQFIFGLRMRLDGKFVPRSMCTMQTKRNLQTLSLIFSEDHKWSIFAFFVCYEESEATLVAIMAIVKLIKPEIKTAANHVIFATCSFLQYFIVSIIFNWTKWLFQFVPFLPFPVRDPLVHDIMANFHMTNHIRSRWRNRNRLNRELSRFTGSRVSRFRPWVSQKK